MTKAELEAQVIATYEAKVGWTFELAGIDLSGDLKNKHTNTVTMELTPTGTGGNLGLGESDTLAKGIVQLASDVNSISKSIAKDFSVGDFGLTLEVEVEKSGGVKIVAGGEAGRGTGHKIKLTFRPTR